MITRGTSADKDALASLGTVSQPLQLATEAVRSHADLLSSALDPDSHNGMCLPAVALVSWFGYEHLGIDVHGVLGTFRGIPHWWSRYNDVIIDPLRHKFDFGPAITRDCAGLYVEESSHSQAWTHVELALAEAQRVFLFAHLGREWALECVDELRAIFPKPPRNILPLGAGQSASAATQSQPL